MTKSNFKISYDRISVASLSLLRHRKRHQSNVTRFFYFVPLPIKISGYASATKYRLILFVPVKWKSMVSVSALFYVCSWRRQRGAGEEHGLSFMDRYSGYSSRGL